LTIKENKIKQEALITASKLSKQELNNLIDELLDKQEFDEATIFAKIYKKRYC